MSQPDKPRFTDVLLSVLASMFGVQSQQNYQRDFSRGSLLAYVMVGVVLVGLFVLALVGLVNFILA